MKLNNQYIKEYYNPNPINGELVFEIFNITQNLKYIQVIVQIINKNSIEYLSYDIYKLNESNKSNESNESNETVSNNTKNYTLLIIGIIVGSFILVIVIIMIIIIVLINKKNKFLMEQVNKISFANEEDNKNEDLLLGKENIDNI